MLLKTMVSGVRNYVTFGVSCKATRAQGSNAHGHYDVAVAAGFVASGPELAGGLIVFQFETDRPIGCGAQEIEKILSVETDGDGIALELLLDGFPRFAVFRTGSGNFEAFFR